MIFKKFILAAFLALAGTTCHADDAPQIQPIGPFGGLNTNISQEAIDATQSPDLLNVDISPGGKSVKKRQGFGIDTTLTISTSATHNLYKFFDSSGNEVRLVFNDYKVSSSVNGAAWSVILTTGTYGATWDCTDYLGFAYCVSSAFDNPIKTNGTTTGTSGVGGTNAVPAGSIVSNSGDRLLVGATASNPSRLYYSASAVFTDFSLGIQPSNSSFEDIVAPGSKLTHIAYRFGRWLWWKDQSFGFIVGTGQFDLQIITVSNTIGTLDNTDVYDGNYVYFRGSDSQIYTYDGSNLSRAISIDIAPTLRTANRRKANSWMQTSQTDFNGGSSIPAINISTTVSVGDVAVSSFQSVENSSTQWNSGSAINITIGVSSLSLVTNNLGTITDPSFEGTLSTNYVSAGATPAFLTSTGYNGDCTLNPQSGSKFLSMLGGGGGSTDLTNPRLYFNVLDMTGVYLSTKALSISEQSCAWTSDTFSDTTLVGKRVKFQFHMITNSVGTDLNKTAQTVVSYIYGGPISYYFTCETNHSLGTYVDCSFDNVSLGTSTIASGSFTSQIYDVGFTSPTYQLQTIFTANTSTPTFSLLTSTNNTVGPWVAVLTSTGTNAIGNRYARYCSTISLNSTDAAFTYISTATILARSTGTYYSNVNFAPNITSWSTLGITDSISGNSAVTYYSRASTGSFTILSSTPNWASQTKNATVAVSTGTYMQLRADFAITAATESPTLNDFTFNWFEGTAADKMYATYFQNGIWFSVSLGTAATTNNRILRHDLLSNLWTLYNIPANGFLTYNNNLYFGDPTAGKIYQFGNNVTSDNGTAINAYWKSKAFFGDSPFTDKDLRMASWYIAKSSGTSLTLTYTLNESTTVSRSLSLFDSRKNVIQNNWNFPLGSVATNFNVQFGDNSSNSPWEVFGGVVYFVPRPWKVSLQ